MDWSLATEKNRAALKRIVAMLVAIAGLAAGDGPARQGVSEAPAESSDCAPTLPRHLHRAILRLVRPAESAVRRLIVVMARGLAAPPVRPRRPAPAFPHRAGVMRLPPGSRASAAALPAGKPRGRKTALALPLLDPLKRSGRPRRPDANGVPRISLPGIATPFALAPRRPPAPDDRLDATRLALRLQALDAALGDLPRQARRFARWRQRKETGRDAAGAQSENPSRRTRRSWPLRPGRPPGQRPLKWR
ncbi:hypothetical protein, partial [Mesorhizobium marinum]|uniref:hypothetical protein n=1 Tax=Mesorhizobium marinum TaxID=3228790 RepID=UPI003466C8ED